MAKPLREAPPSSSVARLLDIGAAARAVATVEASPPPAAQPPIIEAVASPTALQHPAPQAPAPVARTHENPSIKRELVLTPAADETFSRLVELYRRTTGTRLTSSHVARSVMKGIAHCMDQLEREAKRFGPMKLPSNARGRELERERFEARIADAFVAGIRASSAFDQSD